MKGIILAGGKGTRLNPVTESTSKQLLPIAIEMFGQAPFPVKTQYTAISKSGKSKGLVCARRLYFESYYSFIIADFLRASIAVTIQGNAVSARNTYPKEKKREQKLQQLQRTSKRHGQKQ